MSNPQARRKAKAAARALAKPTRLLLQSSRGRSSECPAAPGTGVRRKRAKYWVVYLATDMETGEARYVGITSDLKKRTYQHINDPASAIYAATQKGALLQLLPLSKFANEGYALFLEHALIASIPNLLNRDVGYHKRELAEDARLRAEAWETMSDAEKHQAWIGDDV